MIGIVVVSHSPRLATAAVDLALEMVGGDPPRIAIAAGAGDGVIGTDATRVAAAIEEVSSPEGVLVFTDLGSAVLSATMALEFLGPGPEVRLSDAPFVEGLIAGVVVAAAGASLAEVEREAHSAMDAKQAQLGDAPSTGVTDDGTQETGTGETGTQETSTQETGTQATLVNPDGLHSRPAASIVRAMSMIDANVTITNATSGRGPARADSLVGIMSLGAKEGDVIRIAATGPMAQEAVEQLLAMVRDGFGELPTS